MSVVVALARFYGVVPDKKNVMFLRYAICVAQVSIFVLEWGVLIIVSLVF